MSHKFIRQRAPIPGSVNYIMDHKIKYDLSALDIQISNAGEIIEKYRKKYTSDGAKGMPPHITLLYPFLKTNEYTQQNHNILVDVISKMQPFSFRFEGVDRFPGVLYLKVSQKEKIINIIQKIVHEFPDFLPYGGKFPINELTPHLSIAVSSSEKKLDFIEQEFINEIGIMNLDSIFVEYLSLSVRISGNWIQLSSFQLKNV